MKETKESFEHLTTEARNPLTLDLDTLPTLEILRRINAEDKMVPLAVEKELPRIAEAVEKIVAALAQGGRLFYVGAGTSGRLGALDAAELPPTFGTDPQLVQAIIAGGAGAFAVAMEGAEDDEEAGKAELVRLHVCSRDVVVGIAASGRTPFVMGALRQAAAVGAGRIALVCNPDTPMSCLAEITIAPVVGPEVIMGSTRMKAGTAQKLVLNMMSTAVMVRLGRVYSNLMVDMRATNAKLRRRAVRVLMLATGCGEIEAEKTLEIAGNDTKLALVMLLAGTSRERAAEALFRAGGRVREALKLL